MVEIINRANGLRVKRRVWCRIVSNTGINAKHIIRTMAFHGVAMMSFD
jgi:hypothetical protein